MAIKRRIENESLASCSRGRTDSMNSELNQSPDNDNFYLDALIQSHPSPHPLQQMGIGSEWQRPIISPWQYPYIPSYTPRFPSSAQSPPSGMPYAS